MLRFLRLDLRLGDLASSENHSRRHERLWGLILEVVCNRFSVSMLVCLRQPKFPLNTTYFW